MGYCQNKTTLNLLRYSRISILSRTLEELLLHRRRCDFIELTTTRQLFSYFPQLTPIRSKNSSKSFPIHSNQPKKSHLHHLRPLPRTGTALNTWRGARAITHRVADFESTSLWIQTERDHTWSLEPGLPFSNRAADFAILQIFMSWEIPHTD